MTLGTNILGLRTSPTALPDAAPQRRAPRASLATVNPLIQPSATPSDPFAAVDAVFQLTGPRGDLLGQYRAMTPEDRATFLQVTASLLKQGIVGNEILEINGQPYHTDTTTRLGDPRLRQARPYPLNLRA